MQPTLPERPRYPLRPRELANYRNSRGVTQRAVAARLGATASYVSHIELNASPRTGACSAPQLARILGAIDALATEAQR